MLRKFLSGTGLLLTLTAAVPAVALAVPQHIKPAVRLTARIDPDARVTLFGSVHPLVGRATDRGAVADATAMNRMLLVLKRSPEQDKALTKAIGEMERSGSKSYRKW